MKWIGQHIWKFITRFREDIYLEKDPGSSADTQVLVRNSGTGKVTYNTGAGGTTWTLRDDDDDSFSIDDGKFVKVVAATGTLGTNITGAGTTGSPWVLTVTSPDTDTNTQLTDEYVEDLVGAMVTGNTETNITVTYQDSDGTLDFAVATQAEYLEESFNLYTRNLTGTEGTSTGTIMDHTVSTMSAFTVGVSLAGMTYAQAIKGSTRCAPGARTLVDGKLVISGTGATQGTLAIFKATVCYDDEQPNEPPMTLMGTFTFNIDEGGDEAPDCIDISIDDGEILPTQTVVPVLYNFASTEPHTMQGVCTLTWQKND